MTAIAAVSLDLDNTLVDRDGACRRWWAERLASVGASHALDRVMSRDEHGWSNRALLFGWATACWPRLGSADALWAAFRVEIARYVQPDPAVCALVDALREQMLVVVCTDGGSQTQRDKLDAAGLTERVDAILVSTEVGARKPDPRMFAAVVEAVDRPASAVLHVGDHPLRDVQGARAAGLQAWWVCGERAAWPGPGAPPDRVLASILELPEVLPCPT